MTMRPYKRLAAAVLTTAFDDAGYQGHAITKEVDRDSARRFLCGNSGNLNLWCAILEIHPDLLRRQARKNGWCEQNQASEGG